MSQGHSHVLRWKAPAGSLLHTVDVGNRPVALSDTRLGFPRSAVVAPQRHGQVPVVRVMNLIGTNSIAASTRSRAGLACAALELRAVSVVVAVSAVVAVEDHGPGMR